MDDGPSCIGAFATARRQRPERHDQMLAMVLDEIGDIRAEQVRLAGIRHRADSLSTSTRSNGYDLELHAPPRG